MSVTEIYCPNQACLVRNVEIVCKHPTSADVLPSAWVCPGCGQQARINWTVSDEEYTRKQATMRDIVLAEEEPL